MVTGKSHSGSWVAESGQAGGLQMRNFVRVDYCFFLPAWENFFAGSMPSPCSPADGSPGMIFALMLWERGKPPRPSSNT